jgi:D-galactarolactone cycloisomerase
MKITNVETFALQHALDRPGGPSTYIYRTWDELLVKITTDDGLVGWGETAALAGVRAIIDDGIRPLLIGHSPLEHRLLWRKMWGPFFGNGLAVGAVDIALHDLRGKALNVPVAELYGGRLRDRVVAYGSTLGYPEGLEPEQAYPQEALELIERGFRAVKMRIGGLPHRRDLAAMTAVRQAVGPDTLLMADGNGAYTLPAAIQMGHALEALGCHWFEEPIPQAGYLQYETLTEQLDIAIAAGEALGSRLAFNEVISRHAMDIVQPDVTLCGGIGECLFVAELARLSGIQTAPHHFGGAIGMAATLHVLALLPDASWGRQAETPMLEFGAFRSPFRDELITQPFQVQDGYVAVPTGPGLGIEVNEAAVRRYAVK